MLIFSVSFQFYRMISEENPLRELGVRSGSARRGQQVSSSSVPWSGALMAVWVCRCAKNLVTLLDLCVSSLRRGHANLLCIVPILSDDLRRESTYNIRGPTCWAKGPSWSPPGEGGSPGGASSRFVRVIAPPGLRGLAAQPAAGGRGQKLGNSSRFVRVILAQGPC